MKNPWQKNGKQTIRPTGLFDRGYREYKESFGEGMLVQHKRFGRGVISKIDEDYVEILFEEEIRKIHLGTCYEKDLLKEI